MVGAVDASRVRNRSPVNMSLVMRLNHAPRDDLGNMGFVGVQGFGYVADCRVRSGYRLVKHQVIWPYSYRCLYLRS